MPPIELLYPTTFSEAATIDDVERARLVAVCVLHENGMADFSVSGENVTTWKSYFIFGYFLTDNPNLAHGGGAALVVRKKDYLGGMVYLSSDWMEQNPDVIYSNIPKAFANYDASREN